MVYELSARSALICHVNLARDDPETRRDRDYNVSSARVHN